MQCNWAIHFSNIFQTDPRVHNHNFRHQLDDILIIAVLATIYGADGWTEIERFGLAKAQWLATFLSLPNGIPGRLLLFSCVTRFYLNASLILGNVNSGGLMLVNIYIFSMERKKYDYILSVLSQWPK